MFSSGLTQREDSCLAANRCNGESQYDGACLVVTCLSERAWTSDYTRHSSVREVAVWPRRFCL